MHFKRGRPYLTLPASPSGGRRRYNEDGDVYGGSSVLAVSDGRNDGDGDDVVPPAMPWQPPRTSAGGTRVNAAAGREVF